MATDERRLGTPLSLKLAPFKSGQLETETPTTTILSKWLLLVSKALTQEAGVVTVSFDSGHFVSLSLYSSVLYAKSYCTTRHQLQDLCYNQLIIVGTSRGQADGFGLDILAKLKDVKSKVCVSVLLCT